MNKLFITPILFFSLLIVACSDNDYKQAQAEKEELARQLEEERFAAPKLLEEAKAFFKSGNITMAEEKLILLNSKHGEKVEAIEGKNLLTEIEKIKRIEAEKTAWTRSMNSDDVEVTEMYINQYPQGKFNKEAKARLKTLKIQKEKNDYANALERNSSALWKQFLEEYPNRSDISSIKRKIIQAEVDEIMRDSETGELPSFQQISYGYSSNSQVTISNDTECELTIRYSGDDVKMITIPARGNRSVALSSGNYKITASACGLHYGGTENLSGDYNSRYYIVSSRY